MSQPNFPIIASIAAEELSLSHILNAEGEKLQYVLGTLPGLSGSAGVQDVLDAPVFPSPTGPNGPNPTATAGFAANTAGTSLTVALGGTPIPLPSAQALSADITPNAGNTIFTVATAGRYRISYHVNTAAALLMGSRLVINGANNTASTIAPVLSVSSYENEIEVSLPVNSTITPQLYPIALAGVAVLRSGSAGASLMIVRLS